MAKLGVEITTDGGIAAFWVVIDDQDVNLTNGRGSVDVTDDPDHHLAIWFSGPARAALSFEIKQRNASLAKGKSAISVGQKHGFVAGPFTIKVPAATLLVAATAQPAKARAAAEKKASQ